MSRQPTTQQAHDHRDLPHTFAVVQRRTIGEVAVGFDPFDEGPTPYEAAFRLIGQCGDPGTFEFPLPDGGVCSVEVAQLACTCTDDEDTCPSHAGRTR